MSTFAKYLLSASALAFLAACGGSSDTADTPVAQPEKTEEIQVTEPKSSTDSASAPGTTSTSTEALEPDAAFATLPEPYKSASFALGKRVYKQCSSCHLLEEGAGHLVGPNLNGMFGRQVGSLEDFQYSKALEEADFEWTAEQLDGWLANPRNFLKGNRMSFAGVRKEDQRTAVIAYIMAETGYTEE